MCGIVGILQKENLEAAWVSVLNEMGNALRHRGPDAGGIWFDLDAGIGFSHRRLSILDLSDSGAQPMISHSGRYIITFNGEIYNFPEIKRELEGNGYKFRGSSDTEVILSLIDHVGFKNSITKLNGMFAFAVWDRRDRILYLARDRFGEKPLYYGWIENSFVFCSELHALTKFPNWHGEIDKRSIASMLQYSYVPGPYSIYQGMKKLQPGTYLRVDWSRQESQTKLTPEVYWAASSFAKRSHRVCSSKMAEDLLIEELSVKLSESVKRQMISDVPLGAFLSGGIDSSVIASLMQAHSMSPIKTFTIGFEDTKYNEAHQAKAIASHLGTAHTELYITARDALELIPKMTKIYDEPFGDPSQIPTFMVANLARQSVVVSLSGDGGDELFAGYNRHFWVQYIWSRLGHLSPQIKNGLSRIIMSVAPHQWDSAARLIFAFLPESFRQRTPGDNIHKVASLIPSDSIESMYIKIISKWENSADLVRGGEQPWSAISQESFDLEMTEFTDKMMFLDTVSYLPDDILTKVDRACMAVGLESRVPFLDPALAEFSWELPLSMKIRDGRGKWILRQVLQRYVPASLTDKPKMGFSLPLGDWLRGPLRPWAEDLLSKERMEADGILNSAKIIEKWREHIDGGRNWQQQLWNVLMLQSWLTENHI